MKILMVNDHLEFGGGGDAVFRLERSAYEAHGDEVFTFSHAAALVTEAGDDDLVHIESPYKTVRKLLKFTHNARVEWVLRDFVAAIRPNLIRVHLVSKYPTAVYRALRGTAPIVQTLHGPNLFCATSWGCIKADGRECTMGVGLKCVQAKCVPAMTLPLHLSMNARLSSLVKGSVVMYHCPSKHLTESCAALGYQPAEHIPLGVDEGFLDAPHAKHDGSPTVLFVGAVAPPKGVDILLRAFSHVVRQIPSARLLIAGRGPSSRDIMSLSGELGLESHVKMLGFVERKDMAELYSNAHVVAVPSIWKEQFGLVGVEALACGVPCVGSDIGGIPEWLTHNEHGYLVKPRNISDLAERIIELLVNRALRLRLGANGRAYVRATHSPERYKQAMLATAERYCGHPCR